MDKYIYIFVYNIINLWRNNLLKNKIYGLIFIIHTPVDFFLIEDD